MSDEDKKILDHSVMRLIKINGGNRKRGLMAWANTLVDHVELDYVPTTEEQRIEKALISLGWTPPHTGE